MVWPLAGLQTPLRDGERPPAILIVILSRAGKVSEGIPAEALHPAGAGRHSEP